MNRPFLIPSIAHKSIIDDLCSPLHLIGDIKYLVIYIIFNDGKKFVLSSTPENFLSMYWGEEFFTHDYSDKLELFTEDNYYLCDKTLGSTILFKETLELKFNMHRTFYITRQCPECRFVFGALHGDRVNNSIHLYKTVLDKFENFCIDFLDKTIDIIKLYNPNYNRSIILNDKSYRKSIIKRNYTHEKQLTEREVECLFWAANGKSSDETAIILNIKKFTVEEYRKNIKRKLSCTSIASAIYEGVKFGYIGAFHRLNSDFFKESSKGNIPSTEENIIGFENNIGMITHG